MTTLMMMMYVHYYGVRMQKWKCCVRMYAYVQLKDSNLLPLPTDDC